MKRINTYTLFFLLVLGVFSVNSVFAEPTVIELDKAAVTKSVEALQVQPSLVVKNSSYYVNKTIKFNARFDKFSTLGLDYPPALRKAEDYITFLVYRDDTSFDIPLPEMKLFIKREEAQKFIDLKAKDKIQVTGNVFSNALGDAWVDVVNMEIVK